MQLSVLKTLFSAVLIALFSFQAFAQTTISGSITDVESGESLIGVNILVKGTVLGTITDYNGNFNLKVSSAPPFTLAVSSIGYEKQEIEITSVNVTNLKIKMTESFTLGQEVVVSASRVEESILKSPVSIEKMDILAIQNTSSDTYYKAIANLKGVDVATSSINFQIINTRGFASTGNTRFVQLIDGMDTQAPALNFPIGNLNGPSELDVESVEMIPGASSALYGPSAFNGVLLINSKSPFEYQGVSAFVKTGVNHVGSNADQGPAPMYEMSLRYAKAFNNKIAFKTNISYSKADDWHGTSTLDRNANLKPKNLSFNPGADMPHFHGDEAGINLAIFQFSDDFNFIAKDTRFSNGDFASNYVSSSINDLPNQVVTLTPYKEVDLIDYGAENFKLNSGLFYRVNDNVELSYMFNGGWGTSIYTGAQRYSLNNFSIMQHRLQMRGDNFQVKAYATLENSGDSYITEFLAKRINDLAVGYSYPNDFFRKNAFYKGGEGSLNGYLVDYGIEYLRYLAEEEGLQPGEFDDITDQNKVTRIQKDAHNSARAYVDGLYHYGPGQTITDKETGQVYTFEQLKDRAKKGTVPNGPGFADRSAMYHAEAQYDFKNEVDFVDLQVGGSFRVYDLGSEGTIFPDTVGNEITIQEVGLYTQVGKDVTKNFKLSGSLRFDKNQNFKGQFSPRISGVYSLNNSHFLRVSLQTGFRFPTTQGQYIDLDIISRRLLGGLPEFYEAYRLDRKSATEKPLVFTQASVDNFRNEIFSSGEISNTAIEKLNAVTSNKSVKSEQVKSIELGYKSLIQNKLMIDAVYYYNLYTDFITQIQLVVAQEYTDNPGLDIDDVSPYGFSYDETRTVGDVAYNSILNGTSNNTFQIYTNIDNTVRTQGAAIGLTYNLPKGYTIGGNYSWNQFISGYEENALRDFNTPEHKFNLKFENRKVFKNAGFSLNYRWQEEFRWESSFAIGDVPAYQTLDAQVSYKLSNLKSILKLGGSNLFNKQYIQSLGGPNIGAIYYISLTFDELMN